MKVDLNTARLDCARVNHSRLTGVELGVKSREHVDIPAPIAWYDIEKDGKNNDSPDRNIITDFSGNGRHLTLYNFAYAGTESGYHGYERWLFGSPRIEYTGGNNGTKDIYQHTGYPSFYAKLSNMKDGDYIFYYYRNSNGSIYNRSFIRGNGTHYFPGKAEGGDRLYFEFHLSPGVVVEVLPNYPNGLIFDGVDDYAQFVGDLGLKDYTVILDRGYNHPNIDLALGKIPLISSIANETDTPFIVETRPSNYRVGAFSYNKENNLGVRYGSSRYCIIQTPTKCTYIDSYNSRSYPLERGASTDTGKGLSVGGVSGGKVCSRLILYKLLIFDVTLTAKQIRAARVKYGFKQT